jgi:AraC family transcriptional regulator of adaptative response / DNA-3-methyladenine glycosylase II
VVEDFERCYRAVQSRDRRFDGWFYVAVTTTGIYCRPSCPAVTPKRPLVSFYPSAAACQADGYRACRRCRPDATPGSPEWNGRADVVARAMRLIADGVVDREGVAGLARLLGYSARHLHRQLSAELGAGPIALARSQRAHTARLLLETTDLPCGDVAFAAGFSSIRQFNDTIAAIFELTPSGLRRSRPRASRPAARGSPGEIRLRLPFRAPMATSDLFLFLAARAVAGVEQWDGRRYLRTMSLPSGAGVIALAEGGDHVDCRLWLSDLRDLATAVQRARRLLDLDADPVAVAEQLGADPLLAAGVEAAPGRRIPGTVDGAELALRAVLGQQVTVAAGCRLASHLAARCGRELAATNPGVLGTWASVGVEEAGAGAGRSSAGGRGGRPVPVSAGGGRSQGRGAPATVRRGGRPVPASASGGGRDTDPVTALRQSAPAPTRLFPDPSDIAGLDPATLGMPLARGRALVGLAAALAEGRIVIDPGVDRALLERQLIAQPGVGPWTAAYIALRGLGDPDAFLAEDLGVRRALAAAGAPSSPAAARRRAERWRPWRGYALQYLWAEPAG